MEEYIVSGFWPCEPYILHLFDKILTTQGTADSGDILDCGGSFFVQITIKKFDNIFKTIEYIILPEVFTEFIMTKKNYHIMRHRSSCMERNHQIPNLLMAFAHGIP